MSKMGHSVLELNFELTFKVKFYKSNTGDVAVLKKRLAFKVILN